MCLRIKSRSPPTRKFSDGSEMDNREWNLSQLRILNILPLPMFRQLNDIQLLSKITHEEMGTSIGQLEKPEIRGRKSEIFKLWKTQTERARSQFGCRNCRHVNWRTISTSWTRMDWRRLLKLMWKFFNEVDSESNVYTRQLSCDCPTCRNKWTLF